VTRFFELFELRVVGTPNQVSGYLSGKLRWMAGLRPDSRPVKNPGLIFGHYSLSYSTRVGASTPSEGSVAAYRNDSFHKPICEAQARELHLSNSRAGEVFLHTVEVISQDA